MDKNSMLYWWPKVRDTLVPKPETIIIETGYRPLLKMLDGEPLPGDIKAKIIASAEQLGYPATTARTSWAITMGGGKD